MSDFAFPVGTKIHSKHLDEVTPTNIWEYLGPLGYGYDEHIVRDTDGEGRLWRVRGIDEYIEYVPKPVKGETWGVKVENGGSREFLDTLTIVEVTPDNNVIYTTDPGYRTNLSRPLDKFLESYTRVFG
jgi:hypothetical protein